VYKLLDNRVNVRNLFCWIMCYSPPKTDKQVMVSGAMAKVSFLCLLPLLIYCLLILI